MGFIEDLEASRTEMWHGLKEMVDRAIAQKRDLRPAEQERYNQGIEDMNSLKARIDKFRAEERSAEAAEAVFSEIKSRMTGSVNYVNQIDQQLNEKFREIIRTRSFEPVEINLPGSELRSGFQPGLERRSLVTSSGSGMTGTTFWSQLQTHLVDSSAILAAGATVIQTDSGETLKVPKSSAFSTASIVSEAAAIPTSDPTLGTVSLGAYKYGFLVQVSYELAEDSKFDLVSFLAEQAGTAIGNAFGANAVTGTGSGQPRGALTDASLGVTGPTGTATSFGSQTTAGQGGDLLLDLAASLAEPYARSASAAWLMRNSTLNAIRKLRDSTGNYVFSTDIIPGSGSAGTLLGRPVYTDPNVPAMGANAKSVLFGDISRYWVRQVNGLRFERSNDYAFANDLVTFRCLARLDGALTDTTGCLKYFQHSAT